MEIEHSQDLGELLLTAICLDCGTARLAEVRFCPVCRSKSSRTVRPAPHGKLITFTEVFRAPVDDLEWELPFGLGLVELEPGSRCLALIEWEPTMEDIERPVDLRLKVLKSGLPLVLAALSK